MLMQLDNIHTANYDACLSIRLFLCVAYSKQSSFYESIFSKAVLQKFPKEPGECHRIPSNFLYKSIQFSYDI